MKTEVRTADHAAAPSDPNPGTLPEPEDVFVPGYVPGPPPRRFSWERFGGKFLVISVLVHLLFFAVAGYLIVQTIQAKHKLTFQSGPKGPNAPTRALEHKVQMKKQKNALSAPPQAKRVTTTGLSKVALPDMPAMPSMSAALSPGSISGMGTAGLAPGGVGGNMGGMGGNGAGTMSSLFGNREGGIGLTGTFYDLKQDRNRKPTGMDPTKCAEVIMQYVKGGFNEAFLSQYFKAPKPLYAPQIFTPLIDANSAPTAFGMGGIVKPTMWAVHYIGKVIAPESGTFRFVGVGDDFLCVRFNGKVVLDRGSFSASGWKPKRVYHYDYDPDGWYQIAGHGVGDDMQVVAGITYTVEIIMGEVPGGLSQYQIFLEKDGVEYKKDKEGNPILPLFRMANLKPPPIIGKAPPYTLDGPIWKSVTEKAPTSVFDTVR